MKQLIKITTLLLILVSLAGCTKSNASKGVSQEAEAVHTRRTETGRYYTDGTVITADGNIWGYTQDIISDKPSYNNQPVYAVLDDNGTPDEITDDIILGLVWDVETAIYDELETALSDSFELEREDNNIHIISQKEEE